MAESQTGDRDQSSRGGGGGEAGMSATSDCGSSASETKECSASTTGNDGDGN